MTKCITIVGLGPGPVALLTKEAESELLATEKIFFRTGAHPVYDWLKQRGKHVVSFDKLYDSPWKNPGEIYEFMVSALLKEVELTGKVTFALPGSPVFLEDTTRILSARAKAAGATVHIVHGLSFVEEALSQLNLDFAEGLQIVLPWAHLEPQRFTNKLNLLVCQIEAKRVPEDSARVDLTRDWLLRSYPAGHAVTLIWTNGPPDYATRTKSFPLQSLVEEYGSDRFFSSLLVPPLPGPA